MNLFGNIQPNIFYLRNVPVKIFKTIIKEKVMNSFIQANLRNNTRTDNNMPTNSTSGKALLDLLFLCGASRNMSEPDIVTLFNEAYQEDPLAALRILFYARDIEKGLGERRFFRVVTKWLGDNPNNLNNLLKEENFTKNIVRIDDLIYLVNHFIENKKYESADKILNFLFSLMENKTLSAIVAKWMPRKKSQYKKVVKYMRSHGFINSYSSYRHKIVSMSNTVEQKMSANEWNSIKLENVPSLALKKYKKAFERHGLLKSYIEKVVKGEAVLHAKRLFPYQIVKEILNDRVYKYPLNDTNRQLLNEQWKRLQELDDLPKEFRVMPVIDTSGSMTLNYSLPLSIALGIGLFMAENNPNPEFRNYFITFSDRPEFQKIMGVDIVEKVKNAMNAPWGMNTNLEAVFEMILRKAVDGRVPENEMPTTIVIISDMEFDNCIYNPSDNAIEMINRKYKSAGYSLPNVVFWNVNGRLGNIPAQLNDKGVLLVSGASQNVINFILKKGYENMMSLVYEIVDNPRYKHININ